MSLVKARGVGLGIRTPVTWTPNEKDAAVTLSSNNRVATATTSADQGAGAWLARKSGKFYFEFLLGAAWSGGDTGIGGIKQGASKPNFGSFGGLGLALFPSSTVWNGGSLSTSGVSPVANDAIGVALDLTNNLGWFTRNGSTWSFSGSPASGTSGKTGGWTIGDNVVPAVCFSVSGLTLTLRTRQSDFTWAIPSGFSAWEP